MTRVPVTPCGRVLPGSASLEFFAVRLAASVTDPEGSSVHVCGVKARIIQRQSASAQTQASPERRCGSHGGLGLEGRVRGGH